MRFNLDDLKRGNVSKERIQEVVHQIILKVDPKLFDPEVLRRTSSLLIETLQKQFIFKKHEPLIKDELNQKSFEKKALDEKKFFIKIYRANTQLLIAEAKLELEQQKLQRDAMLDKLERLGKAFSEKLIDDIHYQQSRNQINADLQRLQALMDERVRLIGELNDLYRHRDDLIRILQNNENDIRMARQDCANSIIQNAHKIDFFSGMSPQDVNLWANGRVAILELEVRDKFKARVWRDEAKAAPITTAPGGVTTQFQRTQRDARIDQEYDRKIQQIEQSSRNQLRQLARAANCKKVDYDAPEHVFDAAIATYDNHAEVKARQESFVLSSEAKLASSLEVRAEFLEANKRIHDKRIELDDTLSEIRKKSPTNEAAREVSSNQSSVLHSISNEEPNSFGNEVVRSIRVDSADHGENAETATFSPNEFGNPDALDPNEFGDPDAFDPNEFGDPDDFNPEQPVSLSGASLDDLDFSSNKVGLKSHVDVAEESKISKKSSKA